MNKYLQKLKQSLKHINPIDKQSIINFYTDYLRDGNFNSYQQCVNELGLPKVLAHQTVAKYLIQSHHQHDQLSSRNNIKAIWWILLAITSAPVTLSLLAVLITLSIALSACWLAVFLSLLLGSVGVVALGFVLLIHSLWDQAMFYLFTGIGSFGLWLMLLSATSWTFKWLIYGIRKFSIRLYVKHVQRKREAVK